LFLATYVTYAIQGVAFKSAPEVAWRYVFLCGLIPAVVAFAVRVFVKEPERWQHAAATSGPPRLAELFAPGIRNRTLSGLAMAVTALIMWWSVNAFIPTVATGLADLEAGVRHLVADEKTALKESWKQVATNAFNLGV
jgi:MFS family permease